MTAPRRFSKGDRVQVRQSHDETWLLMMARTPPGTVDYVYDDGTVIVHLDDEHGAEAAGQAVPYPEHEMMSVRGDA